MNFPGCAKLDAAEDLRKRLTQMIRILSVTAESVWCLDPAESAMAEVKKFDKRKSVHTVHRIYYMIKFGKLIKRTKEEEGFGKQKLTFHRSKVTIVRHDRH